MIATTEVLTNCVILSGDKPVRPAPLQGTPILRNILISMGYDPQPVVGKYGGEIEQSLIVPNLPISVALRLANWFGQESILSISGEDNALIFSDGSRVTGNGIEFYSGEPDDNYTKLDGLYFTANLDF